MDDFTWRLNSIGEFSVKSCYDRFKAKLSGPPINSVLVKALNNLWKVILLKFCFFGWSSIHNRIATKDQLFKRVIFVDNIVFSGF